MYVVEISACFFFFFLAVQRVSRGARDMDYGPDRIGQGKKKKDSRTDWF